MQCRLLREFLMHILNNDEKHALRVSYVRMRRQMGMQAFHSRLPCAFAQIKRRDYRVDNLS